MGLRDLFKRKEEVVPKDFIPDHSTLGVWGKATPLEGVIKVDATVSYTLTRLEILGQIPIHEPHLSELRRLYDEKESLSVEIPSGLGEGPRFGYKRIMYEPDEKRLKQKERALNKRSPLERGARYVLFDPFALQYWIKNPMGKK